MLPSLLTTIETTSKQSDSTSIRRLLRCKANAKPSQSYSTIGDFCTYNKKNYIGCVLNDITLFPSQFHGPRKKILRWRCCQCTKVIVSVRIMLQCPDGLDFLFKWNRTTGEVADADAWHSLALDYFFETMLLSIIDPKCSWSKQLNQEACQAKYGSRHLTKENT